MSDRYLDSVKKDVLAHIEALHGEVVQACLDAERVSSPDTARATLNAALADIFVEFEDAIWIVVRQAVTTSYRNGIRDTEAGKASTKSAPRIVRQNRFAHLRPPKGGGESAAKS
jgi:hypothetical protein